MRLPDYLYNKALHVPGVYAITCSANGKTYVGSAINLSLRWRGHYRHLERGTHHCLHLQHAWSKYGPNTFAFSVLEHTEKQTLRAREQAHIDSVSVDARFNSTPTAGSLLGFKASPETIERLRKASTGRKWSEETRARLVAARKGINPRPPGWVMPAAGRAKISAARAGKPLSPEHRAKSIALLRAAAPYDRTKDHRNNLFARQRKLDDLQVEEARAKYLAGETMHAIAAGLGCDRKSAERAIRGHGHYGAIGSPVAAIISRTPSEETKQKLSAATKGRPKSAETRAKMTAAWTKRRAAA